MTFPSTVLPVHPWSLTKARSPGSTSAANASGTLTLIVTMSDRATMNSGAPVGPGLGQVAGVDVPLGDDAVEGRFDLGVGEARLDGAGVGLATSMAEAAATTSERAWSSAARLWVRATSAVLTWAAISSRAASAGAELVPGLVEQAAGLCPRRVTVPRRGETRLASGRGRPQPA